MQKKTVCLNMIVKNEAHVIEKCLASVAGFIDYWVIFDTGSTDNTQNIIKNFLRNIPGELHESPWVNFSHNRNEVLEIAKTKANYSLIIDADEQLIVEKNFKWPDLSKDFYTILVKEATHNQKWFLINHEIHWKWVGVMHETITSQHARSKELIVGAQIFSFNEGARSKDPKKTLKDALILEEYLKDHPKDPRSRFYAAICYYNSQEYDKALYHFNLRTSVAGDEREVFMSYLLQGKIYQFFSHDPSLIIAAYQNACLRCPERAEGWFYLGAFYQTLNNFEMSYQILKKARTDIFIEPFYQEYEIYNWKLDYFLARACLATNRMEEIEKLLSKMLICNTLPSDIKLEIEKNLRILESQEVK